MNTNSILSFLMERTVWISATILFLLLIRPLMKRLPRIGLYVMWIALVFRILCPFDLSGIYRLFPDFSNHTASFQESITYGGAANQYRLSSEQRTRLSAEVSNTPGQAQPILKSNQTNEKTERTIRPEESHPFAFFEAAFTHSSHLSPVILLLWGLGFLFCLGYLMRSLQKDKKILRDAVPAGQRIYLRPHLETSFVTGFWRPRIYLPAHVTSTERSYLLAHEQVHIQRQDFRIKPIAYLAFSTLWFNPLCWLAWHLMLKDMEISCDEAVIRHLDTKQRKYYSHLLLTISSGQTQRLKTSTAFGANIVKERILHIMKYKNPTKLLVTMTFIISLLCACGVGSSPAESTKAPKQAESDAVEDAVYVEQTIGLPLEEDEDSLFNYTSLIMDQDKHFVWLGQKYDKKTLELVSYVKATLIDDGWTTEETDWSDVIQEKLDAEYNHIVHGWYADNGALYIAFSETTISMMKYLQAPDHYRDQYEVSMQHLVRIDENNNTAKEIDIPKSGGNGSESFGNNIYIPLSNGNYIVSNSPSISEGEIDSRIYNGATDEVIGSPEKDLAKKSIYQVCSGDDFLCYATYNDVNKTLGIEVCDLNGGNAYTMDYEVSAENITTTSGMPFALGVSESEIILLTKEGIYHAEYGETTFTKTADCKDENIYYLLMDRYQINLVNMWVADRDDFYVMLYDSTSSEKTDFKICRYFKK